MEYQLYQFFLFFVIYAILGFIINIMYRAIAGETSMNTKVCKGPYCPAYGFGALALIFVMGVFPNTPPVAFVAGAVVGSQTEVVTILLTGICSGEQVRGFKWYHPLLWGVGATILMTHVHQLVVVATNRISPWIHLGFLVVFLIILLSDYVDGAWDRWEQTKENHQVKDN